ncbi:hypothetical protein BU26DRAFT_514413 [Trematosphaeria pertusa]|uniref:Uncharacterized protein n=1 Tax=Trematosphaeria pertusa TaxID=390896 RepID=A0A6A6IVR2_9PLEO|nr:uncharacterized protein BU26DRAFT_514413 [Trematosphaeria pertusa]KAF2254519.1 hypothetical protein BU26DRAFT_514413 [Trematosphaeria pertusa]
MEFVNVKTIVSAHRAHYPTFRRSHPETATPHKERDLESTRSEGSRRGKEGIGISQETRRRSKTPKAFNKIFVLFLYHYYICPTRRLRANGACKGTETGPVKMLVSVDEIFFNTSKG